MWSACRNIRLINRLQGVRVLEQAAALRAVSLRRHHGVQRLHHRQGLQGVHVQVAVQGYQEHVRQEQDHVHQVGNARARGQNTLFGAG